MSISQSSLTSPPIETSTASSISATVRPSPSTKRMANESTSPSGDPASTSKR